MNLDAFLLGIFRNNSYPSLYALVTKKQIVSVIIYTK